jgi:hypothetical protein
VGLRLLNVLARAQRALHSACYKLCLLLLAQGQAVMSNGPERSLNQAASFQPQQLPAASPEANYYSSVPNTGDPSSMKGYGESEGVRVPGVLVLVPSAHQGSLPSQGGGGEEGTAP